MPHHLPPPRDVARARLWRSMGALLIGLGGVGCRPGEPSTAPVTVPPVITAAPASRVVPVNSTWEFVVAASGQSLRFQWRRDGRPIPGATSSRFTFRPLTMGEGGQIDVVVTNAAGSVATPPVEARVVTEAGPWRNDLRIASSGSPLTFSGFSVWVRQGGVPSLAVMPDGRLIGVFQWFPFDDLEAFDRVAVVFSSDSGRTWTTPRRIAVQGFPDTLQRPFDPTITVTPDGRLRLYFTSNRVERGVPSGILGFFSALSGDGVTYTFEPGARFVTSRNTVDCAVTRWDGQWHLISPIGAPAEGAYHAVSTDGLTFTRLPDIGARGTNASFIGNLTVVDGVLRFYGSSPQGVWVTDYGAATGWSASTLVAGAIGGDPAVIQIAPARWLMVFTQ